MRRSSVVACGLFLLGLALRLPFVSTMGTYDMNSYTAWGKAVHDVGLVKAFLGIYFPIQYQIFAASRTISDALGLGPLTGIKLVTLGFDIASLVVLAGLLRRWGLPMRYVWIYWLNPFFVVLFWLGYVDAQIAFLVLLALYLADRASGVRGYLLAGIPLGIAFQMKPQVETVTLMVVVYVAAEMVARRTWRPEALRGLALVVPAILLFVAYSLYFWSQGAWILELAKQYSPMYLALQMESLTANMLNLWYPVAYLQVEDGARIYTVTGPGVLHTLGALLTLALWAIGALAASRLPLPLPRRVLVAVALAVIVQPFTLTRVHENHFFLGATLGILLIAALRDRRLTVVVNALLVVQAAHLLALYGLGHNTWNDDVGLAGVNTSYMGSNGTQTLVALVAVALSAALLLLLFGAARSGRLPADQDGAPPRGRSATTSI